MNDKIETKLKKVNTDELRKNLSKYLLNGKGDVIYITYFNRLIGELTVYSERMRIEKEFEFAKKMIEMSEEKN
ncbi:MAG: hypothetical protein JW770_02370 [Actinobacteria bacterium]|nr:hypothetical protein [Actinomycetota bacterium]